MLRLTVILVLLGSVGLVMTLGSRPFKAPVSASTAKCNPTQRRADLFCPCRLLPSGNGGIPLPCSVASGSVCLPFSSALSIFGISSTSSEIGVCQCPSTTTRNAVTNTCSANLIITLAPTFGFVACDVLAGQITLAKITVSGGVGPYTIAPVTVFSSGDFPGTPQFAPLYIDVDPNNRLNLVPTENAPDLDVLQCVTITATDAINTAVSTVFCADIETTNVCPRTNVQLKGVLNTPATPVPNSAGVGTTVGKLTGSGGKPPYKFSPASPTIVSCEGEVPIGGDVSGCNVYLSLLSDGTLVIAAGAPVPLKTVTNCISAVVTDATGATGTAPACITFLAL